MQGRLLNDNDKNVKLIISILWSPIVSSMRLSRCILQGVNARPAAEIAKADDHANDLLRVLGWAHTDDAKRRIAIGRQQLKRWRSIGLGMG